MQDKDRTYSEKVAGLFSVIQGLVVAILLGAGIFVLPVAAYLGFWAFSFIVSGQQIAFGLFTLLILFLGFGFLILNILLFVSYVTHFAGRLSMRVSDRLWIFTILYNAIFFFPALFLNFKCAAGGECYADCTPYGECNWFLIILSEHSAIFLVITIWWMIATLLPFLAMLSCDETSEIQTS